MSQVATLTSAPRAEPVSRASASRHRLAAGWFAVLMGAICFEGFARKYVPLPDVFFYFVKDLVLLGGLAMFGVHPTVRKAGRWAYGGFALLLAACVLWTVFQVFNPAHESLTLGIIGLRAYWLWWLAPFVIATALRDDRAMALAMGAVALVALAVALLAFYQFTQPATAEINAYARRSVDYVPTTGRARVASTFSYISGFTDFVSVVPGMLLAFGLPQRTTILRWLCLGAALLAAASIPTSGSRSPVFLFGLFILVGALGSGVIRSRAGRRALLAGALTFPLAVYIAPEAVRGVQDRWEAKDSENRIMEKLALLPPVSMSQYTYPAFGIGTGMQQNARKSMGVRTHWFVENPEGRYLIELGVIGYLLFWFVRIGLVFALVKAGLRLRSWQRRPHAAAAFGLAAVTMMGGLAHDHVWQAIYFVSVGFVLASLVQGAEDHSAESAVVRNRPALLRTPGIART
jgi:hypothetical protein